MSIIKPHYFFIGCVIVFGFLTLIFTPPFQSPDEFNHFYRAYQISEGKFIADKTDQRVGGELPSSLVSFTNVFRSLPRRGFNTTNWETIHQQWGLSLEPEKREWVDFPNTAMYTPVSYLPQALGIAIFRLLHVSPLLLFYGARLLSLLVWMTIISMCIRWLPFHHWLMTLLALLPMSVFINVSLNADMITNALAWSVVSFCLYHAYTASTFKRKDLMLLLALTLLLALAKIVYVVVAGLFILIPVAKIGTRRKYTLYLMLLFLTACIPGLLWSAVMSSLYTPYAEYNPAIRDLFFMHTSISACANMHEQLTFIRQHFNTIPHALWASVVNTFPMYFSGFIGTLGWLDLEMPLSFVRFSYLLIFLVAFAERVDINPGKLFRPWLVLLFIGGCILILCSQFLTWSCVGAEGVDLIQGRYLIPIAPLFFFLWYRQSGKKWEGIKWVVMVYSIMALSYSVYLLYDRYFNTASTYQTITCDAEEVTNDGKFTTAAKDIVLENGNTQTGEAALSGLHAVKVSPEAPYSFTYKIHDFQAGDAMHVEAWRLGEKGGIIISSEEPGDFVYVQAPSEKKESGWQLLKADYPITYHATARKEVTIFIYYTDPDQYSYFDDIKISHLRRKSLF